MRLLLDTHAFVWAVATPDELTSRVRGLIGDPTNEVFVSAASAWEIATKHRLGKFPQAETIIRGFSFAIERLRSSELAIGVEHALTAGDFDQPHRDPFDRMLAAQAVVEGATLMSRDAALSRGSRSTSSGSRIAPEGSWASPTSLPAWPTNAVTRPLAPSGSVCSAAATWAERSSR